MLACRRVAMASFGYADLVRRVGEQFSTRRCYLIPSGTRASRDLTSRKICVYAEEERF